jgi:hypothetical protein
MINDKEKKEIHFELLKCWEAMELLKAKKVLTHKQYLLVQGRIIKKAEAANIGGMEFFGL